MRNIFKILLTLTGGYFALSSASCGSASEEPYRQMPTDTICWKDSLQTRGGTAMVMISGEYPKPGGKRLRDSVRVWITDLLRTGNLTDTMPLFVPDPAVLTDGQALAALTGEKLIEAARTKLAEAETDDDPLMIDFNLAFKHVFESDSLLTYTFKGYSYMGGARGQTLILSQTFDRNTGMQLTWNNCFQPSKQAALMALVRDEIRAQYLEPRLAEWGGQDDTSINDVLLIEPEKMELPVSAPEFRADGVIFRYQRYNITYYIAGSPWCKIPYSQLMPFMTPEARRRIPRTI